MSKLAVLLLTLLLSLATYATGAPASVQPASIADCGATHPDPGSTVEGTLRSGGFERSYRVQIPPNYTPEKPSPTLIALHGRNSDAHEIAKYPGMSTLDAVVVYPQALVGPNGETAWSGAPYSPDVDDVAFIGDLLDRISRDFCVDTGRAYALGISNGGGLAAMLGCRLADRFAGYATIAGAFYPEAGECHPSRALPLINFHGTRDTVVPYNGDPAKGQPPIPQWLDQRAAINGCRTKASTETPAPNVERERWQSCAAPVEHYRIIEGGHGWPTQVDTSRVVWNFLTTTGTAVPRGRG